MTIIYSTYSEAFEAEILAPLGEYGVSFDTDAMAADLLESHVDYDEDGDIRVNRSGFRLRDGGEEDFWDVAHKYDANS